MERYLLQYVNAEILLQGRYAFFLHYYFFILFKLFFFNFKKKKKNLLSCILKFMNSALQNIKLLYTFVLFYRNWFSFLLHTHTFISQSNRGNKQVYYLFFFYIYILICDLC